MISLDVSPRRLRRRQPTIEKPAPLSTSLEVIARVLTTKTASPFRLATRKDNKRLLNVHLEDGAPEALPAGFEPKKSVPNMELELFKEF